MASIIGFNVHKEFQSVVMSELFFQSSTAVV